MRIISAISWYKHVDADGIAKEGCTCVMFPYIESVADIVFSYF